jgi:hypothetical protein
MSTARKIVTDGIYAAGGSIVGRGVVWARIDEKLEAHIQRRIDKALNEQARAVRSPITDQQMDRLARSWRLSLTEAEFRKTAARVLAA